LLLIELFKLVCR